MARRRFADGGASDDNALGDLGVGTLPSFLTQLSPLSQNDIQPTDEAVQSWVSAGHPLEQAQQLAAINGPYRASDFSTPSGSSDATAGPPPSAGSTDLGTSPGSASVKRAQQHDNNKSWLQQQPPWVRALMGGGMAAMLSGASASQENKALAGALGGGALGSILTYFLSKYGKPNSTTNTSGTDTSSTTYRKGGSMPRIRMPHARRFQMGGAAGGASFNPPPGFNPAMLQAALAQQAQGGGGMPPGMPPGPPPGGPLGGMPAGAPPPGAAMGPNPGLQAALQAAQMRQMQPPMAQPGAGAPAPALAGIPGGGMPNQMGAPNPAALAQMRAALQAPGTSTPRPPGTPAVAAIPPAVGQPPGGANAYLNARRRAAGAAPAAGTLFRKGGSVSVDGDTEAKKARPDRQWGKEKSAEELPPEPEKKAKGGSIKKRAPKVSIAVVAKKPPVPTLSPYDDEADEAPPPSAPPSAPGMAKGGKWIQKSIKHPGALHKQLGVPQGKKIPEGKLEKAAKAPGKLGKRARLAETLKGMNKAKGGECKDKMAAGGAAKVRHGFPNTIKAPKRLAKGGKVRGCGTATKGCNFSGVY
jgi:hypothetical protein